MIIACAIDRFNAMYTDLAIETTIMPLGSQPIQHIKPGYLGNFIIQSNPTVMLIETVVTLFNLTLT